MKRVLIVDDSSLMRTVLAEAVRADAALDLVGEADDGHPALDLAAERQPDVIVLDNDMPTMPGLRALPELRRRCPEARIVMWSSDDDLTHLVQAAGGQAFLSKSEPIEVLLKWLRDA